MDKKLRIFGLLAILITTLLIASLLQVFASPSIDRKQLNQSLEDNLSSAKEAHLILDQYQQHKLPFTYTQTQIEHLNKKVNEFYQNIEQGQISDDVEPEIKQIEPVIFDLSLTLKNIESSSGEQDKLQKAQIDLKAIANQLQNLQSQQGGK